MKVSIFLVFFSEKFLILRRTERYGQKSILVLCTVPVILVRLNFLGRVSKNTRISNFMKIRPVGAELFDAEGRTDAQT